MHTYVIHTIQYNTIHIPTPGQIERDEFVTGYMSYLDKLNGKPQVVLEKGDAPHMHDCMHTYT